MDEDARSGDASLSRRKMLKRMGITGAVVWVTPVVSSLTTPAFAASAPTGACQFPAGANSCFGQTPCGEGCYCNQNVTNGELNGDSFCTQPTDCSNQLCSSNSDCPPGTVCQATCCAEPRCFVVCNSTDLVERTGLRTTSFASAPH